MRCLMCVAASFLAVGCAAGQQCAQDSQGNQVCVKTQANQYSCGCLDMFGSCHFMQISCNDVVVQKTAPTGQTLYTRVLGGESDQSPKQFLFDAQNNVVLFGTTYSKQFPVTPNAVQSVNAGPTDPFSSTGSLPGPGGDLFLSVLSPAGDLLYSTFLGSSGDDTILSVGTPSNGQAPVLVSAGGTNFPLVPAGTPPSTAAPVLFTFDMSGRTLIRSAYLPAGAATMRNDGTVAVTTAGGLYTFRSDGQQLAFVSLSSFAFTGPPQTAVDPAGDLWLVGQNTTNQPLVAKLTAGTIEAFRWILPLSSTGPSYLKALFFGPDGSAYLTGFGTLLSTTPNALLESPCPRTEDGIVAVLSPQGDLKLLSNLPYPAPNNNQVLALDLSQRPKVACVADVLDRLSSPPPTLGVGEIVRLQGGGFGPGSPTAASPGSDATYPASLGNLSVLVNGTTAPILSAGPGEVVFAIPFTIPDGDAVPVIVQDQGQQSTAFPIAVRASAPWLVDPIWNQNGTRNWFDTPAPWGSVVTLYVTGAGPYSPPLADGQAAPLDTAHGLQLPVSVGLLTTGPLPEQAKILYAGPAPGLVGVAQINVQLPASEPYSSFAAILTIGSVATYLPSIWLK